MEASYTEMRQNGSTFWQALAILLIGGPLAALFASWPIALGQGLRALADVAEYVRDQQSSVRGGELLGANMDRSG